MRNNKIISPNIWVHSVYRKQVSTPLRHFQIYSEIHFCASKSKIFIKFSTLFALI